MLQISWKRRGGGLDESGKEMAKKVQEALHSSTTVEAYKYKEEKK